MTKSILVIAAICLAACSGAAPAAPARGDVGPTGAAGAPGAQGPQGPQGPAGAAGIGAPSLYDANGVRLGTVLSVTPGIAAAERVTAVMLSSDGVLWPVDLGSGFSFPGRATTFYYSTADCSDAPAVTGVGAGVPFRAPEQLVGPDDIYVTDITSPLRTPIASKGAGAPCAPWSGVSLSGFWMVKRIDAMPKSFGAALTVR